jgi:hypothetical protein
MSIVFFCQSCGARFEVDPRMAGKKGHCKKCGQSMTIPEAGAIASMAAMPALASAPARAGKISGRRAGAGDGSIGSALQAGISKVGLAPLTVDRMPILRRREPERRPSPLDDAEDSKPYVLAQPIREKRGTVRVQENVVLRVWRQQLGGIQRVFRWINETAYLISVPFIMLLLVGTMARNRPMALCGAVVVVLLNIGRLFAAGATLAVVPFRDGLNWKKLRKPLRRFLEPVMTIGLVVLAFVFIPFLSTGKTATTGIAGRMNAGLDALEKRALGELDSAKAIEEAQKRP